MTRRFWLAGVLAVMLASGVLSAQQGFSKHDSLTVSTSAVSIPAALLTHLGNQHPSSCIFSLETDRIRMRYDGTAPTSTTGHEFYDTDTWSLSRYGLLVEVQFIRSSASSSDATLRITCHYE